MSLLDDEEDLINNDEPLNQYQFEMMLAKELFAKGDVICTIAEDETNYFVEKIAQAHNLNINATTDFATKLQSIIRNATNPKLRNHSTREIVSLDCRGLKKGDTYGWMANLAKISKVHKDLIVVINYVTQIPNDPSNLYDNNEYVTNLLLRSWKNEHFSFGDYYLDRSDMTIILTCPSEDHKIFERECGLNSYIWIGVFDEWVEELKKDSAIF